MQPSHQQQQHHHHLFSAIGTFLHSLQPSSTHNSFSNSNPSPPSSLARATSDGGQDIPGLYQAFESHLAQLLSSITPSPGSPIVDLLCLQQFMGLLLATQTDLRNLVPSHQQSKTMEEFLERSIKLLDVCREIKDQMTELEAVQGMLHLVLLCLCRKQGAFLNKGQVNRARRALELLLPHMDVEKEGETRRAQTHRSFRGRLRERLGAHHDGSPRKWRSWHATHTFSGAGHASHGSSHTSSWHGGHTSFNSTTTPVNGCGTHVTEPSKTLHALELTLTPPKLPAKDEDECFCAAIYALHVVSIFFLATISAALPCCTKNHVHGIIHPPNAFAWTSPFIILQERVHEELWGRGKKRSAYGGMWELDQITSVVKRLLELTSREEFPWPDDMDVELMNTVKQLVDLVEKLDKDTGDLNGQINEYYNRIVLARMEVLNILSKSND